MLPKTPQYAPCIIRVGRAIYLNTTDGRRLLVSQNSKPNEISDFLRNAFHGENGLNQKVAREYLEAVRRELPVYDIYVETPPAEPDVRSGVHEKPEVSTHGDNEDEEDIAS